MDTAQRYELVEKELQNLYSHEKDGSLLINGTHVKDILSSYGNKNILLDYNFITSQKGYVLAGIINLEEGEEYPEYFKSLNHKDGEERVRDFLENNEMLRLIYIKKITPEIPEIKNNIHNFQALISKILPSNTK